MNPAGSTAHDAFTAALAALHEYRLPAADARPAFEYRGPRGSIPATLPSGEPIDLPGGGGPLIGAVRAQQQGEGSSVELVENALLAVDKANGELNALVEVLAEPALAEARLCDEDRAAGRWRGPLHGIPLTVKDVIDVAGAPTAAGSAAFLRMPAQDAASVGRLRAAGAIILGKATTHEFALGVTQPQSRNPHDPRRIPGGSSGGSAITVATGMGLGSLGTDTRASIRVPAALCGVVGFKPTFGRVPTAGVVPLSWTMDHVAPMAATVADAAYLLDVLGGGFGLSSAVGTAFGGLRVGVVDAGFAGCDDTVGAAVGAAVDVLAGMGCRVRSASGPTEADLDAANVAGMIVSRCEAATFHQHQRHRWDEYWEEVGGQLAEAEKVLATDYIGAQRWRADQAARMLDLFSDHDVLALPTAPVVAPLVENFAEYLLLLSRNAIPWSLAGFPAISIPCPPQPGRLPAGLQLVAPPGREDRLVALGVAFEKATVA